MKNEVGWTSVDYAGRKKWSRSGCVLKKEPTLFLGILGTVCERTRKMFFQDCSSLCSLPAPTFLYCVLVASISIIAEELEDCLRNQLSWGYRKASQFPDGVFLGSLSPEKGSEKKKKAAYSHFLPVAFVPIRKMSIP